MTEPIRRGAPLSFVRRTERLTRAQQREWDAHRADYLITPERGLGVTSVHPDWRLDQAAVFGRQAPLTVEIGTGRGDNIVAAAHAHPDRDFLGVEVYIPGLAQTILRAQTVSEGAGLPNLRLMEANAPELFATALAPGSLDELWVFFPDPWPKQRHHKRRLVNPGFAVTVVTALRPGALWRLATDWANYAEHMVRVLDAVPGLTNEHGPGGVAPRYEGRVLTAFERRGLAAGRPITDLTYRRA